MKKSIYIVFIGLLFTINVNGQTRSSALISDELRGSIVKYFNATHNVDISQIPAPSWYFIKYDTSRASIDVRNIGGSLLVRLLIDCKRKNVQASIPKIPGSPNDLLFEVPKDISEPAYIDYCTKKQ